MWNHTILNETTNWMQSDKYFFSIISYCEQNNFSWCLHSGNTGSANTTRLLRLPIHIPKCRNSRRPELLPSVRRSRNRNLFDFKLDKKLEYNWKISPWFKKQKICVEKLRGKLLNYNGDLKRKKKFITWTVFSILSLRGACLAYDRSLRNLSSWNQQHRNRTIFPVQSQIPVTYKNFKKKLFFFRLQWWKFSETSKNLITKSNFYAAALNPLQK